MARMPRHERLIRERLAMLDKEAEPLRERISEDQTLLHSIDEKRILLIGILGQADEEKAAIRKHGGNDDGGGDEE